MMLRNFYLIGLCAMHSEWPHCRVQLLHTLALPIQGERKREKAAGASRSLIAVPYNLCVRIEIEIYAWQIFNLILSGSTDKYHLVLFTIPYTFIGPTQWEAQCVDRVYIHVKYAL